MDFTGKRIFCERRTEGISKKEKERKVVQVNATQFATFYFNLSADACYINI